MTNGIVSIMRGGKVVLKVVTGCDGHNAPQLADVFRRCPPKDALDAYKTAREALGCKKCLVVQEEGRAVYQGKWIEKQDISRVLGWRYADEDIFLDPSANPRWDDGAPYAEIVVPAGTLMDPMETLLEELGRGHKWAAKELVKVIAGWQIAFIGNTFGRDDIFQERRLETEEQVAFCNRIGELLGVDIQTTYSDLFEASTGGRVNVFPTLQGTVWALGAVEEQPILPGPDGITTLYRVQEYAFAERDDAVRCLEYMQGKKS